MAIDLNDKEVSIVALHQSPSFEKIVFVNFSKMKKDMVDDYKKNTLEKYFNENKNHVVWHYLDYRDTHPDNCSDGVLVPSFKTSIKITKKLRYMYILMFTETIGNMDEIISILNECSLDWETDSGEIAIG